jgi:hypothetical protein
MSVFISYSSKNLKQVEKIVHKIIVNGYEVWFAVDSMETGDDYA